MKAKTNHKANVARKHSRVPRKGAPRKSIENRDLNVDNETTNADREEEWSEKKVNDVTLPSDRSVEDEEDREAKRKIADANPADDIQN
ncbi:MAG TPA: hypothetical protein VK658_10480 [Chryseolinea sp.]|nr:hypothetical protein [Chryseolinea sp.]